MRQRVLLFIGATIIFLGGALLIYADRTGLISIFADVPNVPGTVTINEMVDLQKGLEESTNLQLVDDALILEKGQRLGTCQYDVGSPQVRQFFRFQSIKASDFPANTSIKLRFASSLDGVAYTDFTKAYELNSNAGSPDSIDLSEILPDNTHFVRVRCELSGPGTETPRFAGFSLDYEALNIPSSETGPLNFGIDPIRGQAPLTVELTRSSGSEICTWNFGDGSVTDSADLAINHQYVQAGIYKVTLTCDSRSGSRSVNVSNEPVAIVKVAPNQNSFLPGSKVSLTVTNKGPATITLPNATPFRILKSDGSVVFEPVNPGPGRTLAQDEAYDLSWDGTDNEANKLDSGSYIAEISYQLSNQTYSYQTVITISKDNRGLDLTVKPIQGQIPLGIEAQTTAIGEKIWDFGDGSVTVSNQNLISHTYSDAETYTVSVGANDMSASQVVLASTGIVTEDLPTVPILINGFLAGTANEFNAGNLSGTPKTLIATGFSDLASNSLVVAWIIATAFIFGRPLIRPERSRK